MKKIVFFVFWTILIISNISADDYDELINKYRSALNSYQNREYDEALQKLDFLDKGDYRYFIDAYLLRSLLYESQGKYALAINDYSVIINTTSSRISYSFDEKNFTFLLNSYFLRGYTYYYQFKNYTKCIEDLKNILTTFDEYSNYNLNISKFISILAKANLYIGCSEIMKMDSYRAMEAFPVAKPYLRKAEELENGIIEKEIKNVYLLTIINIAIED
jgi:tetratricopeptide (TPR) repeat protein